MAVAGASAVVLPACGTLLGTKDGDQRLLTPVKFFGDQAIAADGRPQRLLWGVGDAQGPLTREAPPTLTAQVFLGEEPRTGPVLLERRGDGIARPYYPMRFSTVEPAIYRVAFISSLGPFEGFFEAQEPEDMVPVVGVGDRLPAVDTPTFVDGAGVDPICTRTPESCPYHEITLAEAVTNGRPTALMVTTPGFCLQVDICGPSLELLIEAEASRGDLAGTNLIHAEVYAAPLSSDEPGELAPIMDALTTGESPLWYEPALFLADRSGTVIDRLDFAWDRTDLLAALDGFAAT